MLIASLLITMPKHLVFGIGRIKNVDIPSKVFDCRRQEVLGSNNRLTKQSFERVMDWIDAEQKDGERHIIAMRPFIKQLNLIIHALTLRGPSNIWNPCNTRTDRDYHIVMQRNAAADRLHECLATAGKLRAKWGQLNHRRKRVIKMHTYNPSAQQYGMRLWEQSSAVCFVCEASVGMNMEQILPEVLHIDGIIDLISEFHQAPNHHVTKTDWDNMKRDNQYDIKNIVFVSARSIYYMCKFCQRNYNIVPGDREGVLDMVQTIRMR